MSTATGVEASLGLVGGGERPRLELTVSNQGSHAQAVRLTGLDDFPRSLIVAPRSNQTLTINPLDGDHGWYSLSVALDGHPVYKRHFGGHLENGRPSRTAAHG